jgi:fumarate hydratase subunit alpha
MRIIKVEKITDIVERLVIDANHYLPYDVFTIMKKAADAESSKAAKTILYKILENHKIAKKGTYPLCQDTGIVVVFLEMGSEVRVDGDIYRAINKGVEAGYAKGFLRKSMADPITRENTATNTPAIIHTKLIKGPNIKISLMTKGAGAENKSALKMLNPSDGIEGIKSFVIDTVKKAGASACPPFIIGVGIGGNFETCAILAKRALMRELDDFNRSDKNAAKLEVELFKELNRTNIGPLGFGGDTTVLGVKVETKPCHIASLPVAVNIQCHSSRHKTATI